MARLPFVLVPERRVEDSEILHVVKTKVCTNHNSKPPSFSLTPYPSSLRSSEASSVAEDEVQSSTVSGAFIWPTSVRSRLLIDGPEVTGGTPYGIGTGDKVEGSRI